MSRNDLANCRLTASLERDLMRQSIESPEGAPILPLLKDTIGRALSTIGSVLRAAELARAQHPTISAYRP